MTELPLIPFRRSYWVVPGRLLAGPYPGSLEPAEVEPRLVALLDCGIRYVINLMGIHQVNHQGQPFAPYIERMREYAGPGRPVGFSRYDIADGGVPTREQVQQILAEIDAALAVDHPVYVHCWGGKGRTGVVVGCYLIRHGLASPETALARIAQLRQNVFPYADSPETEEQRLFVRAWKPGE